MTRPLTIVWAVILIGLCNTIAESTTVPTPIVTPTIHEIRVTPDLTQRSQSLPPTWTPTFTPTITLTPTPSPTYTPTPSLTPFDMALLCNDFSYSTPLTDGETYTSGEVVSISYGISATYHYAFVGVVLEHDALDDVIADILPGGTSYTSNFVVDDFPFAGRWDYRVGAFLIDGDDILCPQRGYFYISEDAVQTDVPSLIPTAQAVPSSTPIPQFVDPNCEDVC